jgi:hypothetical protein
MREILNVKQMQVQPGNPSGLDAWPRKEIQAVLGYF